MAFCRAAPVARRSRSRALSRGISACQRPVARPGPRHLQLPVRSAPRRALRAGPRRLQPAAATSCSPATPSTTPTSSCRPTIRSSRATSSRATSSSPANTARILSPTRTIYTARIGFSRTSIGQNVEANTSQPLPVVRSDARHHGRHRHRRSQALRSAELRQSSAGAERVQRAERSGPGAAGTSLKAGGLAEYYQDNMVNPTFSLGIFRFQT